MGNLVHTPVGSEYTQGEFETGTHKITGGSLGDVLYYDGSAVVSLAPSTAGFLLSTQGPGLPPAWITNPGVTGPTAFTKNAVGAPPYSFAGDLDTGVDSYGANIVNLVAGGQNVLAAATTGVSVDVTTTGSIFELQNRDAGALGVRITTYHNSATPAVSDIPFALLVTGEDSAGNAENYGYLTVIITDPVSTSEDAYWSIQTAKAGALAERVTIGRVASTYDMEITSGLNVLAGNVTFGGTGSFAVSSAGPHAIGGAITTQTQLGLLGTFASASSIGIVQDITTTLTVTAANGNMHGLLVRPTITEFSSGTHPSINFLRVAGTITAGAATTTDANGIDISTFTAQATTTTASGLRIAAPTGATTNYAINVLSGISFLSGGLLVKNNAAGAIVADTANASVHMVIQAGSNAGANTTAALLTWYRTNIIQGQIGVYAAGSYQVGGRTNTATDFTVLVGSAPVGATMWDSSGNLYHNQALILGGAGVATASLRFNGTTSGTITMTTLAAAGTWTFTLPPDDGDAGEQLQTNGSGVTTWEAAASLSAYKNVHGVMDKREGLRRILALPIYDFTYKQKMEDGSRVRSTGDFETHYTGAMAEDAPWLMHHDGKIFNPVSAFGNLALAVQATQDDLGDLLAAIATAGSLDDLRAAAREIRLKV